MNKTELIKNLLNRTKETYTKAVEWAKTSSADSKQTQKVKDLAKKNADWAQRKYVAVKKEIELDEVEQQKATEQALKELNKKKEEEEAAGIVLT